MARLSTRPPLVQFVIRAPGIAVRAHFSDRAAADGVAALLPIYGLIADGSGDVAVVSPAQAEPEFTISRDGALRRGHGAQAVTFGLSVDPCDALFGLAEGTWIALLAADS